MDKTLLSKNYTQIVLRVNGIKIAAISALASAEYALLTDGRHLVSFDQVVEAMKQTGHDLPSLYRETARGGLARVYGLKP